MNQEFLKPRLVGARFDQHSVPLEILKDFAALEEMIIEVAKWKFLQAHQDRTRTPRGFTEGLELHLTQVEEGSAIPVIALVFGTLFPSANATYFDQAREAIIEAVASANQNQDGTSQLPPNLLSYFDRFGRSLREGESMEFTAANQQVARLTTETRRRLIRASQVVEWTEEASLLGLICEADQARMSFELELKDGTKLTAPINSQHLDTVLEAFSGYRKGARVQLQGVVKKNRQDQLKSIESVEHVSPLDPLDVAARMEELAELQDGWLDGKGHAPEQSALTWLARTFETNFNPDLPLPYLYPTAEGGVQAEWTIANWEVTLDIDLHNKTAEYQALHLETKKCSERTLNLSQQTDWQLLNADVQQLCTEAA
ncbi:MAG: hypothetical protein A3H31_12825 [Gallionellales bacterium RIFCSPLOWO2_02_FULL_57_47]|nr:MAG: hypothetical protein A3H31_12825 [Gallionellales bacterium RIFCSPLOWO2_02_FULL_57_47]OGT16291.1 MAG: hypothetical protein A3J49_09125 [Gallionellales bacterium RIFCSPHIGHO2_02_FULL_57_16]